MPDTSQTGWSVERLSPAHERSSFCCGQASLDDFIRRLAMQYERRYIGRTYVAVTPGELVVRGYYPIAAGSLGGQLIPAEVSRKLPRHPLPVLHLGRLAVDRGVQGTGLGRELWVDALQRAVGLAEQMGIYAVDVRALDDRARSFYQRFGFAPLLDDPLHLFLPVQTIRSSGLP